MRKRSELGQLIEENREVIDEMRLKVAEASGYDAQRHDDVHLLRFVLTHGDASSAAAAFRSALAWRRSYNMDAVARDIRKSGYRPDRLAGYPDVHRYLPLHLIRHSGQPVVFISAAEVDIEGLARTVSAEDYVTYTHHFTELVALLCDLETRRTGRLVKHLRLADVTSLGMHHINVQYFRKVAAATKGAEDAYPQLLGNMVIANPSAAVKGLWDASLRHLLPKRMIERTLVVQPTASDRDRTALQRLLPVAALPLQLGGELRV